ncbi:MAG TPA: TRAP transporter small permease [Bacteroidota bacterium]|nr:TRAP transporter small permease [Bacteroidota bacterium]
MKLIRLLDRIITSLITWLLVIFFVLMLGIAALQVVLRIFFHTGILWGDIAARHMVLWVGFFGAYMATRDDKHFHIDVLTRFLSPRLKGWFAAFSDLFAIVICYFMLQASLTFIDVGMDADSMLFLQVSQRAAAYIVPLGFGLIMVQFIFRMIESVAAAIRGETPGGGASPQLPSDTTPLADSAPPGPGQIPPAMKPTGGAS